MSLSELLVKIDKNSTDPKDWEAFEAKMTQMLADGVDTDGCFELPEDDRCFELPLKGPAPPVSIYKKLVELFEQDIGDMLSTMHGDYFGFSGATPEMLMQIVTSKTKPAYTMDHFFLLCDASGGPGVVHYIENEGSREHLKLSLLGIICQRWDRKRVNDVTAKVESTCNIMMQVMVKYPKELWNESAVESGGYDENVETAWECVTYFFEQLLNMDDIKLEDKKRFVRDYYLALKESHRDNCAHPVVMDDIGEFMEKHGIDPTTGEGIKRKRAKGVN